MFTHIVYIHTIRTHTHCCVCEISTRVVHYMIAIYSHRSVKKTSTCVRIFFVFAISGAWSVCMSSFSYAYAKLNMTRMASLGGYMLMTAQANGNKAGLVSQIIGNPHRTLVFILVVYIHNVFNHRNYCYRSIRILYNQHLFNCWVERLNEQTKYTASTTTRRMQLIID